MAGKVNEQRERTIVEVFADLRQPRVQVVAYEPSGQQGPDFLVEVVATGQRVGVEVTELLSKDGTDGRDRSIEAEAHAGIVALCRELLGPSGDVDVRMHPRPRDRAQVQRWLAAFRAWLVKNRSDIMAGKVRRGVFPDDLGVDLAKAEVTMFGEDHRADLERAQDLDWLHVQSIHVAHDASGWQVYGFVGTEHLADRHEDDLDEVTVQAVAAKIHKAAGYDFDGPLWLLLRSFVHVPVSDTVSARIASMSGIERFAEVWLLEAPANTLDAARPPSVRLLHPAPSCDAP